jgi:hypothetical protein
MTRERIDRLRIAEPCQAAWDEMAGDERVRHCTLCSLNVYNFAEMTRDEVRQLLVRTEGRVCARLYRRADGTVLTRDCPAGLRALRRRASRIAAAVIAALLTLPSLAFGRTTAKKPRVDKHGSRVTLRIERIATPRPAQLDGVVRDEDGTPIPGVTIAVRNETSTRQINAITDANGAFAIASLEDGVYRVEVMLQGFKPATIHHLPLKASEMTHASVALRLEPVTEVLVGAIAPMFDNNGPGSMTLTHDLIDKLPF